MGNLRVKRAPVQKESLMPLRDCFQYLFLLMAIVLVSDLLLCSGLSKHLADNFGYNEECKHGTDSLCLTFETSILAV
jgi:hypothetical protein